LQIQESPVATQALVASQQVGGDPNPISRPTAECCFVIYSTDIFDNEELQQSASCNYTRWTINDNRGCYLNSTSTLYHHSQQFDGAFVYWSWRQFRKNSTAANFEGCGNCKLS
jgi:hypothetical protein